LLEIRLLSQVSELVVNLEGFRLDGQGVGTRVRVWLEECGKTMTNEFFFFPSFFLVDFYPNAFSVLGCSVLPTAPVHKQERLWTFRFFFPYLFEPSPFPVPTCLSSSFSYSTRNQRPLPGDSQNQAGVSPPRSISSATSFFPSKGSHADLSMTTRHSPSEIFGPSSWQFPPFP